MSYLYKNKYEREFYPWFIILKFNFNYLFTYIDRNFHSNIEI